MQDDEVVITQPPGPYRPLLDGHVRVLELQPGSPGSQLVGELIDLRLSNITNEDAANHVDQDDGMSNPNGYEAISYCWGNLDLPETLHFTTGAKMSITESLSSALHSFRQVHAVRSLWVDAVCINQEDVVERSAQVALMAQIFRSASKVLVWLGPATEGSETLAFATLNAPIAAQGDRSRKDLLQLLETHLASTSQCACCQIDLETKRPIPLEVALPAVAKLLERSWFGRLWVVQEVALARCIEIYCGSHHASWELFTEIARVPGQFEGDHESYTDRDIPYTWTRGALRQVWARCNYLNQLRARNRLRGWLENSFRPTALCKDLLMMSHLGCRDPRDRIFGVSQVLGLQDFKELRPDYSISVAELYRRTVTLYLTASANRAGGRGAQMLALAGTEMPGAEDTARPSWVPHLQYLSERSRSKYTYYQWTLVERQTYADALEFRCKLSTSDEQTLLVRGTLIGTVQTVLEESACPSKHVHRRLGSKCPDDEGMALLRWYVRCRKFRSEQQRSKLATSTRTIFACYHDQRSEEMPSVSSDTIEPWLSTLSQDERKNLPEMESILRDLRPYITGHPVDRDRHLSLVNYGSRLHAAWVPPTSQPGDVTCYFAGAPYPFIVRQRDNLEGHTLLGDSFVEGFDEIDALDINRQRWHNLVEQLHNTDAELKDWMGSTERVSLKATEGSQTKITSRDTDIKSRRQDILQNLKSMHRTADEALGWIKLR